ncbi:MAG: glycosyltransferase [Dysgonomonas sp.]
MENIVAFLQLNVLEIILLAIFFLACIVQMFFYLFVYNKPLRYQKRRYENVDAADVVEQNNQPSVSVIIVAKEDSANLSVNLPLILTQNYPEYEVIVVNDGFTEETNVLLNSLKLQYSHLYDTFLPTEEMEKDFERKKLAMTIGIKAAKNDVLLFTEPDTFPDSDLWITSMMKNLTEDKDIVLGYCYYRKSKGFINRLARFDNVFYILQYLYMMLSRKPFTASYRNVAYRRELFFQNKGFSLFLNNEHSESAFLNYIMTRDNVVMSIYPDSAVITSVPVYSKWKRLKLYQFISRKYFKNFRLVSNVFLLDIISRYFSFILFIILLSYSIINANLIVLLFVLILIIVKEIIQLKIINKASQFFKSGKFYTSAILLSLIQPLYNLYFRILANKK